MFLKVGHLKVDVYIKFMTLSCYWYPAKHLQSNTCNRSFRSSTNQLSNSNYTRWLRNQLASPQKRAVLVWPVITLNFWHFPWLEGSVVDYSDPPDRREQFHSVETTRNTQPHILYAARAPKGTGWCFFSFFFLYFSFACDSMAWSLSKSTEEMCNAIQPFLSCLVSSVHSQPLSHQGLMSAAFDPNPSTFLPIMPD